LLVVWDCWCSVGGWELVCREVGRGGGGERKEGGGGESKNRKEIVTSERVCRQDLLLYMTTLTTPHPHTNSPTLSHIHTTPLRPPPRACPLQWRKVRWEGS